MVAGLLLPSRDGDPIVWTKSGGLYPLADGCREDARQALGKWIDFSSEKGVVTKYQPYKCPGNGFWALHAFGSQIDVITTVFVPTRQQQWSIGWEEASIWSTVVGRTPINPQMLDELRRDWEFRANHGFKAALRWDADLELFVVLERNALRHLHDQSMVAEQLTLVPWNQPRREELGWTEGVVSHRTDYTMFVATRFGDFILTANAQRHGRQAPDFGMLIECRVRTHGLDKGAIGEVVEYEVFSLPKGLALHRVHDAKFAMYKVDAVVRRFAEGFTVLENPMLGELYAQDPQREARLSERYTVVVTKERNKATWMVRTVIGSLPPISAQEIIAQRRSTNSHPDRRNRVTHVPIRQEYARPPSGGFMAERAPLGPILILTPPPELDPAYRGRENDPGSSTHPVHRAPNALPSQKKLPPWDKYSTQKRQPSSADLRGSGRSSRNENLPLQEVPVKVYAPVKAPVLGVCIETWGCYHIVWLKDGRLALLDTKQKSAALGSFVSGIIEKLQNPIYGRQRTYEWQINGFLPADEVRDVDPRIDGQKSMFTCTRARIVGYRPFNGKRVVVLEDDFFGALFDKEDVLKEVDAGPGEEIKVTIKPGTSSETTIEWAIHCKGPEVTENGANNPNNRATSASETDEGMSSNASNCVTERQASYREIVIQSLAPH
ncbi:unnamed protein product, partial [Mesorhabditis spiculigera]